jgi:hypothetical protein
LWIRLERLPPHNGYAFLNPALPVCLAIHFQPFAHQEFHPACPAGDVPVARAAYILQFRESSGVQVPLTWQSKTIQYP